MSPRAWTSALLLGLALWLLIGAALSVVLWPPAPVMP